MLGGYELHRHVITGHTLPTHVVVLSGSSTSILSAPASKVVSSSGPAAIMTYKGKGHTELAAYNIWQGCGYFIGHVRHEEEEEVVCASKSRTHNATHHRCLLVYGLILQMHTTDTASTCRYVYCRLQM